MKKFKLLFIDEEKDSFDDFLDYIEKSSKANDVEVITQLPLNSMELMIDTIIKLNPDAIITDFFLNEKRVDIDYTVPFNGTELVENFLSIKEGFPCFVLTAFDDVAINEIEDVNKIYVKNILHKSNNEERNKAKATFLDRVVIQIQHYKSKIQKSEDELLSLIEKRKIGKTNYEDENRIIELDTILERSIDKNSFIPENYKLSSNTDKLGELVNKVDDLINKVEKNNDKRL